MFSFLASKDRIIWNTLWGIGIACAPLPPLTTQVLQFVLTKYEMLNQVLTVCIDLLEPQNATKPETHFWIFEIPPKIRISIVRNVTLFSPLDSWHQDLEFGPRMDIFVPLESELWQFEFHECESKKNERKSK